MNVEKVAPPKNSPHLFRMVRVKVLQPFGVRGGTPEIGDEVKVEFHVARDMRALGKCVVLDE